MQKRSQQRLTLVIQRLNSIIFGLSFLMFSSVHSAQHLDLALEQFVGNELEISGVTTTIESEDDDPLAFVVDIDGDGIDEIFVSRADLFRDRIWIMYHDQLGDNGEIQRYGVIDLDIRMMRIGKREGVNGYYELSGVGAGETASFFDLLIF